MRNVLFQINGGIGKCIAATAVCAAIKKKYPEQDLIVVSGYPEIFLNNPNVKKTFGFGNISYFYQDYIENKDTLILAHDPYMTNECVYKKKHLIEIWCDIYNIPYNNEKPEIFLTQREIEINHRQLSQNVSLDKPILLMQTNGGADANRKYSWARDLPTSVIQALIQEFKDQYTIFHVRREDQFGFQDTVQITGQIRQILAVSLLSHKRLVIDSFMQHAFAAFNMPSVACWIVNSPKVFGYDMHTDILCNPFTTKPELRNSYIGEFDISGNELEFPYHNETEIFNIDSIIQALKGTDMTVKQRTEGNVIIP